MGIAIRRAVPVRTFSDWNDPPPGFLEVDMVEHCGGAKIDGNFVHTLVLTDIASAWTECIAMPLRNQSLIAAAFDAASSQLLFPMLGVDTDNDSAFINVTIIRYCKKHQLIQTRSRPYRKNDQAWVEQKNGAVVRKLVGYDRLAGIPTTRVLAKLYDASRLYINYFQPSFKLMSKKRDGARFMKTYDAPATPYERLLRSPHVSPAIKGTLTKEFEALDPMTLLRNIRIAQQSLRNATDQGPVAGESEPPRVSTDAFLAGLSSAWKNGEVRPTHRLKARAPRTWRTRKDPLADVWPLLERWLIAEPTLTAKQALERLFSRSPDVAIGSAQFARSATRQDVAK